MIKTTSRTLLTITVCTALLLAGCESTDMSARQKGTAVGAGMGVLGGAVISAATGGKAGTGAAIGGVVGAIAGNLWSKRQEDRRQTMERASQGTGVEVSRTPDNQLKLNVPNDISFDVGSAKIKPELRTILDSFANSLRSDPQAHVNIIGHTDATGSDATNNPLSLERANSVRNYVVDRGVTAARIETTGRGEHEPVASNTSEAGRAKNRRVEIFIREPA
jgi:outer membrane protein OmpA-like peptidoglycan-associated protein